jgi:protein TonB
MQAAKPEAQEIKTAETVREEAVKAEIAREIPPAVEHQAMQAEPAPVETREAAASAPNQPVAETRPTPEVTARAPAVETPPAMPIVEKPAPVESPAMVASNEPAPVPPSPAVPESIEPAPVPPAPAINDSPSPPVQEQAPVIARSLTPRPAKKADYGWLAESLHRRIVEVRQYPSAARLNGWEGKVVLRVAIRQDGHLDSVSVVKSSGHETLDDAAMEAVRRACPLHMKHELASPMVVVQVPINYSLNR